MRPVGRRGVLVPVADPAAAAARVARSAAGAGIDLVEVVPGAETLLVVAATDAGRAALPGLVGDAADAVGEPGAAREPVEIAVRYEGPDLEEVAGLTGLDIDAVVAAHCSATYRGAFSGFAPGFCYLTGLPGPLRVPRRAEPRPAVPAGAVAIADRYSAVYPRSSPGGWQLIGTTTEALWDSARTPPARLAAGTLVRFRPV